MYDVSKGFKELEIRRLNNCQFHFEAVQAWTLHTHTHPDTDTQFFFPHSGLSLDPAQFPSYEKDPYLKNHVNWEFYPILYSKLLLGSPICTYNELCCINIKCIPLYRVIIVKWKNQFSRLRWIIVIVFVAVGVFVAVFIVVIVVIFVVVVICDVIVDFFRTRMDIVFQFLIVSLIYVQHLHLEQQVLLNGPRRAWHSSWYIRNRKRVCEHRWRWTRGLLKRWVDSLWKPSDCNVAPTKTPCRNATFIYYPPLSLVKTCERGHSRMLVTAGVPLLYLSEVIKKYIEGDKKEFQKLKRFNVAK